jgi:hypothetical protein
MTRLSLLAALLVFAFACAPRQPPPQPCNSVFTLVCDGDELFEIDSCDEDGARTFLADCDRACHLGACVDCVPDAGLACDGDDLVVTDSCGAVERVVQTCPNGCAEAACIAPECEADADEICVGDLIFSADSCGNVRDFVERCPPANPCVDGACRDCFLPEAVGCFDHDLYEYDACGNQLGLTAVCDGQYCDGDSNQCVGGNPADECVPNAGVTCHEGNLHFRDSCNNVQPDIQRECDFGCDDTGCLDDCPTFPIGQVCVDGNVHVLERGCPGTPATPAAVRESCENSCANGLCSDEACAPNAGVVCDGLDRRAVDSCGVAGEVLETCELECERGECQ